MSTEIQNEIEAIKLRIAVDAGMLSRLLGNEPTAKMLANIAGALRYGPATKVCEFNTTPVKPLAAAMREITAGISEETGYSIEELRGYGRNAYLAAARFECWARIYDTGGFSLPQIGAYFGRDHTTILYGVRRAKQIRAAAEARGDVA